MSKAFDCLDHSILLEKLEIYAVRGHALICFESYMTHKTGNGRRKGPFRSRAGNEGHSGTVSGPILFLLYMNDLVLDVANKTTDLANFTNDTSVVVVSESFNKLYLLTSDNKSRTPGYYKQIIIKLREDTKYICICFQTFQRINIPDSAEIPTDELALKETSKFLDRHIN